MNGGIYKRTDNAPSEAYQRRASAVSDFIYSRLHGIREVEYGEEPCDVGDIVQGALAGVLSFAIAPIPLEVTDEQLTEGLNKMFNELLAQILAQRVMVQKATGPGGTA